MSTAVQLVRPDGVMAPMPSHVVKLTARATPSSGMTPKATKTISAGQRHPRDGAAPPGARDRGGVGGAGRRAERARSLPDDLVHVVGELLRGDRELEELGDVVQQRLRRRSGCSAWSHDCAKVLALLATS